MRISWEDYKGSLISGKEWGFTNAIQLQIVHPVITCLHTGAEIKCLWFISISRLFSPLYFLHLQKVLVHYCQNKQNLFLQLQKATYMQDTCICCNSLLFFYMLSVLYTPRLCIPFTCLEPRVTCTLPVGYDNATFSHTLAGNLELLSTKRTGLNEVIDPFCLLLHQKIYDVLLWLSVWIYTVFWSTSVLDTLHRRTKPSCQNIRF